MVRPRYRKEFEELGVEGVKRQVRNIAYAGEQLAHAQEWLEEQTRDASESMSREQISIAREAKDAAWAAARAAQAANTRATIALIIATLSAVATIAEIIAPHYWK